MDSGNNIAETEAEVIQPSEAVAAELEETEATPQAEATEETELYVDVEDGQQTSNMSQEQQYAAWKKEKDKRKKYKSENDELKQKFAELENRYSELSSVVSKVSKGPEPTLEQFDYDEAKYREAVKEYYSGTSTAAPTVSTVKEEAQQAQQPLTNDAAEFHLYQSEQKLTEKFSDYPEAKEAVKETFSSLGVEGDKAINIMANVAQQGGVDIAKVILAANKVPGLITKLAQSNSDIQLFNLMKEAESKIKVRASKKIDSIPNPDIKTNGPVDNSLAAYEKARQEYVANSNIANFKKMQALKPKSN